MWRWRGPRYAVCQSRIGRNLSVCWGVETLTLSRSVMRWPGQPRAAVSTLKMLMLPPVAEQVSKLLLLGLQIFFGGFGGGYFAGDALGDLNTGAVEGGDLVGIIREQPDALDVQGLQDLDGHEKLA